jgi:hypothetical protein
MCYLVLVKYMACANFGGANESLSWFAHWLNWTESIWKLMMGL